MYSIILRVIKYFLFACILASCSEELDVEFNQLEDKFSFNLRYISIEYARHHIDLGVVYIKLKECPCDHFWHCLEDKGWVKKIDGSKILYFREGYVLEYRNEEKAIIIKPRMGRWRLRIYIDMDAKPVFKFEKTW